MSSKPYEVRPLAAGDWAEWEIQVAAMGPLFLRRAWLELFGGALQACGIFDSGGGLAGGFALYHERRWGLPVCRCAPFTSTCGPFIVVQAQHPVAVLEARRKVVEAMADYIDRQRYAIAMLDLDPGIQDALPFFWRGFKVVPIYTYLVDLGLPHEDFLRGMSPGRRNDVSKAVRDGLVARPTKDLKVVRDLVASTFERQGKWMDRDSLEAILFRFASAENSFAFTTERDGRPLATAFVVHDGRTAYYLAGGMDAAERHHGAGPLALMECIRRARELGLATFDFEGSYVPAIESYFRGFGGRLTPYFTVNKAWWPVEMALKFRKRNTF